MKLLSVEEIKAELDREFTPLEPMLTGFRLIEKNTPDSAIKSAEKLISTNFPYGFRELIAKFDFGNLTIGPVVFCSSGDYLAELVELNLNVMWWGGGQRPENIIMIGNSDPFAILLNTNSGSVYAFDSENGWEKSKKISDDFFGFFSALGTVVLTRNQTLDRRKLAEEILEEVGAEDFEFWLRLAN
ncbi:SMI1/KNR4 family protein [Massilia sp.]|uniref:SMI1/KNR4 family protein n=1 Tax=Massilia sp. TaxID=1882437 RepID=UPI00352F2B1D